AAHDRSSRVPATRMTQRPEAPSPSQYRDSRNLASRGRLHERYSNKSWFRWVAERLDLASGACVLDVGCGAGWFWERAVPSLPDNIDLTVTDLSQGMVAEAMERLSSRCFPAQIDSCQADAVSLPFADARFDVVVAMHMLYHVPELERAISETKRVLRPGGKLIVTTVGQRSMVELLELASQAFGGPATNPAALVFDIDQASKVLRAHFNHVEVTRFIDVYAITEADDVFAYLTSMPPGIGATRDQQAKLHELIDDALTAGDGTLSVQHEAGFLIATNGGKTCRASTGPCFGDISGNAAFSQ
ncbi:MAG: class I SAM-dependent methyltransferase, partial [Pseudomonadota bacterium]